MAADERCDKLMWRLIKILIIASICGIIALFLILWFKLDHIYIQQLYIRKSFSNSPNHNTSVVIDIKFKYHLNSNVNITLYCCTSCQSLSAIGICVVPRFNYSWGMAHQEAVVVPRGPSWDDAGRKLVQGSTVDLKVEMTTGFNYTL